MQAHPVYKPAMSKILLDPALRAYFSSIGKRGGGNRSDAKVAAGRANIAKAREAQRIKREGAK